MEDRFFTIDEVIAQAPQKATKFLLYENPRTNGVVWYVPPGEQVPAHYHPATDDVWVIVRGQGDYLLEGGSTRPITAGMVIPAAMGQIHGVRATGDEPLVFAAVSGPMPVKMILEGEN